MRVGPGPRCSASPRLVDANSWSAVWCVPFVADTSDGPRVAAGRLAAVEHEHAVIRHSPPPAATDPKEEQ